MLCCVSGYYKTLPLFEGSGCHHEVSDQMCGSEVSCKLNMADEVPQSFYPLCVQEDL